MEGANPMKILYAASEANPFAKSGGLADVAGALPKALVKDGVDARVIMPLYGDLKYRDKLAAPLKRGYRGGSRPYGYCSIRRCGSSGRRPGSSRCRTAFCRR